MACQASWLAEAQKEYSFREALRRGIRDYSSFPLEPLRVEAISVASRPAYNPPDKAGHSRP